MSDNLTLAATSQVKTTSNSFENKVLEQLNLASQTKETLSEDRENLEGARQQHEALAGTQSALIDRINSQLTTQAEAQKAVNRANTEVNLEAIDAQLQASDVYRQRNATLKDMQEQARLDSQAYREDAQVALNRHKGLDADGNKLPLGARIKDFFFGGGKLQEAAGLSNLSLASYSNYTNAVATRATMLSNAQQEALLLDESHAEKLGKASLAKEVLANATTDTATTVEQSKNLATKLQLTEKNFEQLSTIMSADAQLLQADLSLAGQYVALAQLNQASASMNAQKKDNEFRDALTGRVAAYKNLRPGVISVDDAVATEALFTAIKNRSGKDAIESLRALFGTNAEELLFFVGSGVTDTEDVVGLSYSDRSQLENENSKFRKQVSKAAVAYADENNVSLRQLQYQAAGVTDEIGFQQLGAEEQQAAIKGAEVELLNQMEDNKQEMAIGLVATDNAFQMSAENLVNDLGFTEEQAKTVMTYVDSSLKDGEVGSKRSLSNALNKTVRHLANSFRGGAVTSDDLQSTFIALSETLKAQQSNHIALHYPALYPDTNTQSLPMIIEMEVGGSVFTGGTRRSFDISTPIGVQQMFMAAGAVSTENITTARTNEDNIAARDAQQAKAALDAANRRAEQFRNRTSRGD